MSSSDKRLNYVALKRLITTENYVEQVATNDLPHIGHTLLNIDKNIAKFTNSDKVDFTELERILAAKKIS